MSVPWRTIARSLLLLALAGAATAKVLDLFGGTASESTRLPYLLALLAELGLCALLLQQRTATLGALAAAGGFLGAAGVTLVSVLRDGGAQACACLGAAGVDRGNALAIQGAIVLLAGVIVATRGPSTSAETHHAA